MRSSPSVSVRTAPHPRRAALAIIAVVGGLLALPRGATAVQTYAVTDLGSLGSNRASGYAVNNAGQVAGTSATAAQFDHAFLWTAGVMTDLGTLGGDYSFAYGINTTGDVAGTAYSSSSAYHAFVYHAGVMTDLGPSGAQSDATAINDAGDVVGQAGLPENLYYPHAVLYRNGDVIDLGTLGGQSSVAHAVNRDGVVAGQASIAGPPEAHAFSWDGTMTDLGTLGGNDGNAYGINQRGQVVGLSRLAGTCCTVRAFLYENGAMRDLGTLGGSSDSHAYGINAAGVIVGNATIVGDRFYHAFVYTGGVMHDLNDLIPTGTGIVLGEATAINDRGQIVANGSIGNASHAFLLTPPCGNGQLDAGEACDDGPANGSASCCTIECTVAAPGTQCDGGLCGQSGTCQPVVGCGSAPIAGCQPAASGKSKLDLRSGRLVWKWTSSATVAPADFGDPTADADYQLCVYDASSLAAQARIPAGGTCGTRPCWKRVGTTAYRQRSATGAPDGIVATKLRAGGAGAGKLALRGKGAYLGTPTLPLALPLRVQLRHDGGPACWEASFDSAVVNTPDRLTAKSN
jgi:probable HAF family extracellular repeat protein